VNLPTYRGRANPSISTKIRSFQRIYGLPTASLRTLAISPPEVEARREIRALEELIDAVGSEAETATEALRKLQLLRMKLTESGRPGGLLYVQSEYLAHVVQRLR